jgi:hypothetical protein
MTIELDAATQPAESVTEAVTVWHTASGFAVYVSTNGELVSVTVVPFVTNATVENAPEPPVGVAVTVTFAADRAVQAVVAAAEMVSESTGLTVIVATPVAEHPDVLLATTVTVLVCVVFVGVNVVDAQAVVVELTEAEGGVPPGNEKA